MRSMKPGRRGYNMTMNASLDTNILLRYIVGDLTDQQMAVRGLFATYERLYVDRFAIVELEYALRTHYGLTREDFRDVLVYLDSLPVLEFESVSLLPIAALYVKHSGLSFVDLCLAQYASIQNRTPLYTFDKKLARQIDSAIELTV